MKNILKRSIIYLLALFFISGGLVHANEKVPFAYQSAINFLADLEVMPETYEMRSIATRYDALYLLARADSVNRLVEHVTINDIPTQYADISYDSPILPALYWGDMKFFCGKETLSGSIIADLDDGLTKKQAVIMCLRLILTKEVLQVNLQNCYNADEYLILEASKRGLINYPIGEQLGVEVTTDNLNEPMLFAELCALIVRTMHAPIVTNAYGGYHITYIIDRYL